MKTPAGWALAGMWYDKYSGIPPRGSLLESVFVLVHLHRQQAQLLATRALVQVSMPEHRAAQDPAIEAFQKYCDTMFPFLDRAADQEKEQARENLTKFVSKRAMIALKPIWKMQAEQAKRVATMKRFSLQPTAPGASQWPTK